MKLSIVLPVYGVEKYIRQCVLSIIEQEEGLFGEIELIIVNDGTKDKSIENIQDLVNDHSNITLINQANQGLSVARNKGISHAKGEYVWFVDSDDSIASIALKVLWPYLDGENDLIVLSAIERTNNIEKLFNIKFNDVKTIDGRTAFRLDCAQSATAVLAVCKRSFLEQKDLKFLPGVLHEDNEFCPRVSYYAQRITYLPKPIYYIRRATNDGRQSITTTVNPKRAFDSLVVAASLSCFREKVKKEKDIKKRFDEKICSVLNRAIEVILKCDKDSQALFIQEYNKSFKYLNKHFAGGKIKHKLEWLLFELFPQNICRVYDILQKHHHKVL